VNPAKILIRLVEAFTIFKNKFPKSKIELAITGKYGWGKTLKPKTQV